MEVADGWRIGMFCTIKAHNLTSFNYVIVTMLIGLGFNPICGYCSQLMEII